MGWEHSLFLIKRPGSSVVNAPGPMHRWQFLHFACLSPNPDQCAARRRPQSAKRIFFSWKRNRRDSFPKSSQFQFYTKVIKTKVKECFIRHLLTPLSSWILTKKLDFERVKQFIHLILTQKVLELLSNQVMVKLVGFDFAHYNQTSHNNW